MSRPAVRELSVRLVVSDGLEEAARRELRLYGHHDAKVVRGAVSVTASPAEAAELTLGLRSATRVILELTNRLPADRNGLFDGLAALAWESWIPPGTPFVVRCSGSNDDLNTTALSARLATEAIASRCPDLVAAHPKDDARRNAGVLVDVRVRRDHCSAGLDLGGRSLHRRGRGRRARAPLREDIAAGLALLADVAPGVALIDPFCGSGTLIAEAAAVAVRRAPGRDPGTMPLSRLSPFSGVPLGEIAERLAHERPAPSVPMLAFDADPRAVAEARELVAAQGLAGRIEVRRARLQDVSLPRLPTPGVVLTNPPWGRRLERGVEDAWRSLGTFARQPELAGWTLAALSGHPSLTKHLGLASRRRWPVRVAGADARLCLYSLPHRGPRRDPPG